MQTKSGPKVRTTHYFYCPKGYAGGVEKEESEAPPSRCVCGKRGHLPRLRIITDIRREDGSFARFSGPRSLERAKAP